MKKEFALKLLLVIAKNIMTKVHATNAKRDIIQKMNKQSAHY